jgi:hypothetical protein
MGDEKRSVGAMFRWRRIGLPLAAAVVGGLSADGGRAQAKSPLGTVHEIDAVLRSCWVPPADTAQGKIQVTLRVSFKRNGDVLGQPLIAYENPAASDDERKAIRAAVVSTLQRCSPLPLSAALGDIIAGHPINVRLGEGWRRKDRAGGSP